jgi:hypothetical protein
MDDLALTLPVLQRLRQQGFKVAIDDFGTGYSSLGYLRDLPITSLKVDRSFVKGIVDDPDALAIVASIVDLAKAIGVGVVAEGVETQEQADRLLSLGCSTAQGWLWSKAVPPEEALSGRSLRGPFPPSGVLRRRPPRRRAPAGPDEQVTADHGLDRMLDLHRSGASLTTIAAALNREGFTSPQGVKWHRAAVARAISQIVYPQLRADL